MIELNPIYGGPGIHKSKTVSPYEVLKRIMDEMPNATGGQTFRPFADAMKNDPEMLDACLEYCHTNFRSSIEGLMRRRKKPRSTPEEEKATKEKVAVAIEAVKKTLILDHFMPNGKRLRDCTFGYIGKIGGQFQSLSKMGKPEQIIGKKLSNKQVAAAMRGATKC